MNLCGPLRSIEPARRRGFCITLCAGVGGDDEGRSLRSCVCFHLSRSRT